MIRPLIPTLTIVLLSAQLAHGQEDKAAQREAFCAKQPTASEREICLDRDLTRRDGRLNEVYAMLRDRLPTGIFEALQTRQKKWLETRNACGNRVACLQRTYAQGIAQLEGQLPPPAGSGRQWMLNKTDKSIVLTYGVPETDDISFQAVCNDASSVNIELAFDYGDRKPGDTVSVRFNAGKRYRARRDMKVINRSTEEGIAGVMIKTDFQDPLFSAIARARTLRYSASNANPGKLSLKGSADPTDRFVSDCQNLQFEAAYKDGSPEDKRRWATCKEFRDRKSLRARRPLTVTFINKSGATRGVMWIDYKGTPRDRGNIEPGKSMTVKTFRTHPWMFTDGPGNCVEIMMPRRLRKTFVLRASNPAFGPGQD